MKEAELKMLFFCNISLWIRSRAIIWVVFEADYETPHFIEVSVPSKESEVTTFYCLSIGVWNDSDSMVFFDFFPSCYVIQLFTYMVVREIIDQNNIFIFSWR
jgi:hypothetical protein